jgi:hypothetical protein
MRPISVLQQNIGMSYLLSDDLGDAVRRRLREIAGLGLIALSVVAVAALARDKRARTQSAGPTWRCHR